MGIRSDRGARDAAASGADGSIPDCRGSGTVSLKEISGRALSWARSEIFDPRICRVIVWKTGRGVIGTTRPHGGMDGFGSYHGRGWVCVAALEIPIEAPEIAGCIGRSAFEEVAKRGAGRPVTAHTVHTGPGRR